MGTNYYWYKEADCSCCGRNDKPLHIGKSSGGWYFALHVYPEQGINSLNDWKELFQSGIIKDEYDTLVTLDEMSHIIEQRSWPKRITPETDTCEIGIINNLLRSKIDGKHCIGHGEGTWEYIIGDFS